MLTDLPRFNGNALANAHRELALLADPDRSEAGDFSSIGLPELTATEQKALGSWVRETLNRLRADGGPEDTALALLSGAIIGWRAGATAVVKQQQEETDAR